jgi:hypothetical protein
MDPRTSLLTKSPLKCTPAVICSVDRGRGEDACEMGLHVRWGVNLASGRPTLMDTCYGLGLYTRVDSNALTRLFGIELIVP